MPPQRTPAAEALVEAWKGERTVDQHCHPLRRWPFQLSAVELRSAFTEAIDPRLAQEHVLHSAAYQDALRRIAEELECDPSEEAILELRNAAKPGGYARRLLRRTGADVMLVDHGFATDDAFTLEEQQRETDIKQRAIVRLETLAESLLGRAADAKEWLFTVRVAIRDAVGRGAVAVKTICAYRATLRLRPVDTDALALAFNLLRTRAEAGARPRLSGDTLCHGLLVEAAQECRALDVPLQVHCGFGDPDEDLAEASPLGLRQLFTDSRYRGLCVVLLHCYPYHREAAYLCSVFPDVYMDLSLTIPMAGLEGPRAMREALGLCPLSKLLYASDASRYPEVYFVAALAHRDALAEALGELVDAGVMTHQRAVSAGTRVLAANAHRIYRLES